MAEKKDVETTIREIRRKMRKKYSAEEKIRIVLGGCMVPEFLTAEELDEYLRLALSTVYKLVQEKRLPGFKVGKHWWFRNEAIQRWINEQERKIEIVQNENYS